MKRTAFLSAITLIVLGVPGFSNAQSALPTTQPSVLTIYREDIKFGHSAAHETTEAGWPLAYAKAKSPYTYLGISSITGPNEVWFLAPYANWKALGDNFKQDQSNPALAAELARLGMADAEHVSNARALHLAGRPDLSAGAFPSVAKTRFYEVTFFRVRPGHEQTFEEVARMYATVFAKAAPAGSYRTYQVVAGMPGPTYVVFSSSESLAAHDQGPTMEAALMKAFTPDQLAALQKFSREGLINTESQRFAVNGRMSYVDDATAATDPDFWRPGVKASK